MLTQVVTETAGQSDLQLGARPQGMGGAFSAIADDANAIYWNPAGLGQILKGEFTFMHWTFTEIPNVSVDYFSFAYPFFRGAVGFSWIRQGARLEEGVNSDVNLMSEDSFRLSSDPDCRGH